MKEIARRSKAGFDSLHAELLQKYRDFSTKYRSNTVSSNRQLVKQDKQAVSTSNIHKPKDNQNTLQQTFVSYVAGKGQDEYFAVLSAETNIPPQDARQQSAHTKNIHVPVVNSSHSKANTMPILNNEGIFRQGKWNKTAHTSRRSYKDHYEDIQLTNQHYQPCYDKVYPSLETEHIYKTPQTQCNITNTTAESLKLDEYSTIQPGAEDQISNNVDSIYMNQTQICGTCTVDDYIDMERNENSTSFKDQTSYSLQCDHIAKTNVHVPISDRSIMIQNDAEEQIPSNDGSIYTNQGQMYEIDNIHETEEYIAMARNDTSTSAKDTYVIGSVTCEAFNKVEKPLHQTYSNIIADKSKNTNADSDGECAKEDRMISVTAERPLSAAIVPFVQEAKPKPPIRPRMQFFLYTVEEVVECFNECAMPQLANVCREEHLDGEYFKDLGDEDLAQEPFCLKSFHISKVRKIIAGWRPRRLSAYKLNS